MPIICRVHDDTCQFTGQFNLDEVVEEVPGGAGLSISWKKFEFAARRFHGRLPPQVGVIYLICPSENHYHLVLLKDEPTLNLAIATKSPAAGKYLANPGSSTSIVSVVGLLRALPGRQVGHPMVLGIYPFVPLPGEKLPEMKVHTNAQDVQPRPSSFTTRPSPMLSDSTNGPAFGFFPAPNTSDPPTGEQASPPLPIEIDGPFSSQADSSILTRHSHETGQHQRAHSTPMQTRGPQSLPQTPRHRATQSSTAMPSSGSTSPFSAPTPPRNRAFPPDPFAVPSPPIDPRLLGSSPSHKIRNQTPGPSAQRAAQGMAFPTRHLTLQISEPPRRARDTDGHGNDNYNSSTFSPPASRNAPDHYLNKMHTMHGAEPSGSSRAEDKIRADRTQTAGLPAGQLQGQLFPVAGAGAGGESEGAVSPVTPTPVRSLGLNSGLWSRHGTSSPLSGRKNGKK